MAQQSIQKVQKASKREQGRVNTNHPNNNQTTPKKTRLSMEGMTREQPKPIPKETPKAYKRPRKEKKTPLSPSATKTLNQFGSG